MKHLTIFMNAVLVLTLSSCVKSVIENTKNNPAIDFQLKLTRTTPAGMVSQQIENALNQPGSAEATAVYFEKASFVHIKVGGIQTTTVVPRLSADIHFVFTNKTPEIGGVYNFPADNNRVNFLLSETVNGNIITRTGPASGSLSVIYDPVTKSVSGTISNISYDQVLDNIYSTEVLYGKFSNVGLNK